MMKKGIIQEWTGPSSSKRGNSYHYYGATTTSRSHISNAANEATGANNDLYSNRLVHGTVQPPLVEDDVSRRRLAGKRAIVVRRPYPMMSPTTTKGSNNGNGRPIFLKTQQTPCNPPGQSCTTTQGPSGVCTTISALGNYCVVPSTSCPVSFASGVLGIDDAILCNPPMNGTTPGVGQGLCQVGQCVQMCSDTQPCQVSAVTGQTQTCVQASCVAQNCNSAVPTGSPCAVSTTSVGACISSVCSPMTPTCSPFSNLVGCTISNGTSTTYGACLSGSCLPVATSCINVGTSVPCTTTVGTTPIMGVCANGSCIPPATSCAGITSSVPCTTMVGTTPITGTCLGGTCVANSCNGFTTAVPCAAVVGTTPVLGACLAGQCFPTSCTGITSSITCSIVSGTLSIPGSCVSGTCLPTNCTGATANTPCAVVGGTSSVQGACLSGQCLRTSCSGVANSTPCTTMVGTTPTAGVCSNGICTPGTSSTAACCTSIMAAVSCAQANSQPALASALAPFASQGGCCGSVGQPCCPDSTGTGSTCGVGVGLACVNGVCVVPGPTPTPTPTPTIECLSNSNCLNGYQCVNGVCTCPVGSTYNAATDTCVCPRFSCQCSCSSPDVPCRVAANNCNTDNICAVINQSTGEMGCTVVGCIANLQGGTIKPGDRTVCPAESTLRPCTFAACGTVTNPLARTTACECVATELCLERPSTIVTPGGTTAGMGVCGVSAAGAASFLATLIGGGVNFSNLRDFYCIHDVVAISQSAPDTHSTALLLGWQYDFFIPNLTIDTSRFTYACVIQNSACNVAAVTNIDSLFYWQCLGGTRGQFMGESVSGALRFLMPCLPPCNGLLYQLHPDRWVDTNIILTILIFHGGAFDLASLVGVTNSIVFRTTGSCADTNTMIADMATAAAVAAATATGTGTALTTASFKRGQPLTRRLLPSPQGQKVYSASTTRGRGYSMYDLPIIPMILDRFGETGFHAKFLEMRRQANQPRKPPSSSVPRIAPPPPPPSLPLPTANSRRPVPIPIPRPLTSKNTNAISNNAPRPQLTYNHPQQKPPTRQAIAVGPPNHKRGTTTLNRGNNNSTPTSSGNAKTALPRSSAARPTVSGLNGLNALVAPNRR